MDPQFFARLFNTLTVSLNRNAATSTPYFQTWGKTSARRLGIAGQWRNPSNYGPPQFNFTNYGSQLNDGNPTHSAVQTTQLWTRLHVRRGKHNLTFQGQFTRYDTNLLTDSNGRGTFTFKGSNTAQMAQRVGVPKRDMTSPIFCWAFRKPTPSTTAPIVL